MEDPFPTLEGVLVEEGGFMTWLSGLLFGMALMTGDPELVLGSILAGLVAFVINPPPK